MQDPNAIRTLFAKNLSFILYEQEIKQADFAKLMGVSTASVSDWCNGKKMPRMDKIDLICEKLSIKRSNLLEEDNKKSSRESLVLTDEEVEMVLQRRTWSAEERMLFQQLWDTVDKIPAKDRPMILGMIEAAAAARNRS